MNQPQYGFGQISCSAHKASGLVWAFQDWVPTLGWRLRLSLKLWTTKNPNMGTPCTSGDWKVAVFHQRLNWDSIFLDWMPKMGQTWMIEGQRPKVKHGKTIYQVNHVDICWPTPAPPISQYILKSLKTKRDRRLIDNLLRRKERKSSCLVNSVKGFTFRPLSPQRRVLIPRFFAFSRGT